MPKHKYQIPNPDLPSAIAWERARANVLENVGVMTFGKSEPWLTTTSAG